MEAAGSIAGGFLHADFASWLLSPQRDLVLKPLLFILNTDDRIDGGEFAVARVLKARFI